MSIKSRIFSRLLTRPGQSLRDDKASRARRTRFALSVQTLEERQLLSTFTVTTTKDGDAGSLRQAIISADAQSGASTINFSIGSGQQTITPASALPAISGQVTIDGTSQPGYTGTPLIVIDGSKAGAGVVGLRITGNNAAVVGLAIDHFSGDGILVQGNGNTITADYIGLRATGSAAGNAGSGIIIRNGSNNTIGSVSNSGRNVISANGWRGVWIDGASASGNVVEGNRIGTNAAGTTALANGGDGVSIVNAPNNTIGGATPGAGNLISGNARVGIWINGGSASGNQIEGNFIGVNVTGNKALGNGLSGVMTEGAPNNTIGGTTVAARNIISGNALRGVWLNGAGSSGNVVEGNYIGTRADGTAAVANAGDGVSIVNAPHNTIGGTTPGAGNLISGNGRVGIWINGGSASGNQIEGNFIGVNVTGNKALGNGLSGVMTEGAPRNTIGGTTAAARNVIAGNALYGIWLHGSGSTGEVVQGNAIGANAAGTADLVNVHGDVVMDPSLTAATVTDNLLASDDPSVILGGTNHNRGSKTHSAS